MIPPDARQVLTEALRPPPGSHLDRAVALTFTLDLDSALLVPLAFAGHALRDTAEPLSVMRAARLCADRVDIFFQAGNLRVPASASDLHAVLEPMVHAVRQPGHGRLFHPKLWAVRYSGDDTESALLRLLVLSRNLTQDHSWDLLLRLDGVVGTRPDARNAPLGRIVRAAADLAVEALAPERRVAIDDLVESLRRAEWELPDEADDLFFYALGVDGGGTPSFDGGRHLVISPFCNTGGIALTAPTDRSTLVSRQEDLDRLPEESLRDVDVYVVSELAGLASEDGDPGGDILTGLHAKAFVIEQGNRARLLVGSANATSAAFGGNVELVVELHGRRRDLGIDTMMGEGAGFRSILIPYERQAPVEQDEGQRALENLLRQVAAVPMTATVHAADLYDLSLAAAVPLPARTGVTAVAELLTRRGETIDLILGEPATGTFVGLDVVDITPFLVVTATDDQGRRASTVVRASLVGDPPSRLDEVLARQVDTPEKFTRLLALLLGLGGEWVPTAGTGEGGSSAIWASLTGQGILELLLRGLVERPAELEDLARIVKRLAAGDTTKELLPDGFLDIWHKIDGVRRELVPEPQP